ncbi:hypothetical protein MAPG_09069 [Magnaporthiopsis poae ATCC 64411]|uniref:Uncharacterized protein n=1 Tax=Magnaporthiopsis poae (strain ATCC 64411 / 73-15) TaxID=644358 RepID=A0A0C4E8Z6_MAGP6|nr:hypothetical protein MAPG_09069 [Magnaporthiopsis poae ATCC 64411]
MDVAVRRSAMFGRPTAANRKARLLEVECGVRTLPGVALADLSSNHAGIPQHGYVSERWTRGDYNLTGDGVTPVDVAIGKGLPRAAAASIEPFLYTTKGEPVEFTARKVLVKLSFAQRNHITSASPRGTNRCCRRRAGVLHQFPLLQVIPVRGIAVLSFPPTMEDEKRVIIRPRPPKPAPPPAPAHAVYRL